MQIELPDALMQECSITEREALELLVVAAYRHTGMHATLAGKMLGISEPEFHALLTKQGEPVNYGVNDFLVDLEDNGL